MFHTWTKHCATAGVRTVSRQASMFRSKRFSTMGPSRRGWRARSHRTLPVSSIGGRKSRTEVKRGGQAAPFASSSPPPPLILVELVHHRPERGERVLREIGVQLLVVLGADGLALLALADLEPAALDRLAHRMRRHGRPAERRARSREEPAFESDIRRRDAEELREHVRGRAVADEELELPRALVEVVDLPEAVLERPRVDLHGDARLGHLRELHELRGAERTQLLGLRFRET